MALVLDTVISDQGQIKGTIVKGRALTVGGVVFHYSQTAFKYHHFIRLRTSQQQHKLCID